VNAVVQVVALPQPAKVWSINEISGVHPMSVARIRSPWRDAGFWHAGGLKWVLGRSGISTPLERRAILQFDFDMKSYRRRDGHNYSSTVCKWFIDGLVMAGIFVDDSTDWIELRDPTFTVTRCRQMNMRLRLELT
jgi:hypothetical protein